MSSSDRHWAPRPWRGSRGGQAGLGVWGGRLGAPRRGCRMGLEAPLRERGSASAGRHSDLSPFSSHLLGVSWALGRDSVRALGQSPRGRAGGQLPRDDVTSVTAATLKISAATAGLLPCLLCPGLTVPADVGPGPAGDSALVPTAAVLSRLRPPSPRGGVPAGEGWRGGRVAEGPWGQRVLPAVAWPSFLAARGEEAADGHSCSRLPGGVGARLVPP